MLRLPSRISTADLEERQVGRERLEAVAATAHHRAHHQHVPAAVEPPALPEPGGPARGDRGGLDRLAVADARLVGLGIPALGQHLLGRRVPRDAEAPHLAAGLAPALAEESVALEEALLGPALHEPQAALLAGAVPADDPLVAHALERLRLGGSLASGPDRETHEEDRDEARGGA
jgi:hypothetical protein